MKFSNKWVHTKNKKINKNAEIDIKNIHNNKMILLKETRRHSFQNITKMNIPRTMF